MNTFKKRTFTLPLLAASAAAALRQFPVAVRALRRPATSRALPVDGWRGAAERKAPHAD